MFLLRNKSYFLFLIFIKCMREGKSLSIPISTYLYQIVIKSHWFDFRVFLACKEDCLFDPSSSSSFGTVQMVRLRFRSFLEKIQESVRSLPGKQTSVTENNFILKSNSSQRLDWAFPLRPLIFLDYFAGL